MAKSIKPKDNIFIDSTGIVHNKTLLSEILNGLGSDFTDINRTDLNTFTSGIVIGYGHNLTNSPLDSLNQGHLISVPRHDAEGYVTQYFSPYPTNDVYIRKCEAGTWGKWVLITNNYSLAERCVGTWTDGKPLYRKTIVGTSKLPAGYSTINHNVSSIGTHRVIKDVEFQANGNSWGNTYGNATSFVSSDSITTTAIGFDVGSNWANMFIPIVTIEYTKTTD